MMPPERNEEFGYEFGESLLGHDQKDSVVLPPLSLAEIDALSGEGFEKYIMAVYKKQGLKPQPTPKSGDYGADIVIDQFNEEHGLIIQCKHVSDPSKPMGPDGVHQVLSALGVYSYRFGGPYSGVVITNSIGFTSNAQNSARSNNILLLSRTKIREWIVEHKVSAGDINLI